MSSGLRFRFTILEQSWRGNSYPWLPKLEKKTPLDAPLSYNRDAAPWLSLFSEFSIDVQSYARKEQEIHNFNHKWI